MVEGHDVPAVGLWREPSSYDYARSLPKSGWAWEYVRRNPELRRLELGTVKAGMLIGSGPSAARDVRLLHDSPELERWGLMFFDDLDKTAEEAFVFWRRDICPAVAPVWAIEADADAGLARFDLSDLNCEACMLRADGADHVLLKEAGRTIQLIWNGGDILSDGLLITAPVELLAATGEGGQLAMRRLLDLQRHGRIRACLFEPHARGARLRMCLQALDGRLAGASWRQVASAIFGEERTSEEWASPSRSLLDRTRRLFWGGLAYMKGQYREFLK